MDDIIHYGAVNKHRQCLLFYLFVFSFLLLSNALFAQKMAIRGKVILASDKSEAIGASVRLEGQTVGTVTDLEGNFMLQSPVQKGVLVVSYVGYKTVKVPMTPSKKFYNISLREDTETLDEIVVVGYGTMRKKEVTGAVARVVSDDLSKISTSDLGTAMQGLVAGVNVQASSGEPGAASNIQIRGLNSISGSNSPLFVVDGVPYESDPGLSSSEIESIDVLKDAASAAIYGTRGAAGVILITTKQGKEGEMKVSVNGYYGVQKITSTIDLMNASEFTYVHVLENRRDESGVNNTDDNAWTSLQQYANNFFNDSNLYDVIINNYAPIQNYSVLLSGGKKDLTYSLVANYFDQEGVVINSEYKKYNVRANSTFKRGRWTINSTLGFMLGDQRAPGYGLLAQSYTQKPTQSQIDPNASISQSSGAESELNNLSTTMARVKEYTTKTTDNFNGNFYVAYDIIKGLNISTRLGINYTNLKEIKVNPMFELYDDNGTLRPESVRSGIRNAHGRTTSMTWENMLNWSKKIGKHDFKLTAVFSTEQYKYNYFYASIKDLTTNDILSLNAGSADMLVGTGSGQWGQDRTTSLVGMLGRVQYNYAGKYMFSASLRRDGSSRFSSANRWGMFPSVSAGWNISEEKFWKKYRKAVNSFKLRASLGTTGNQNFADYSYAAGIDKNYDYSFGGTGNETLVLGSAQTGYSNANVVWETTQQINAGIDLGLFSNKFTLGLDFYESNKKNMLFPMVIPPINGAGSSATVVLNAGNMRNRGVELTLGHRNRVGKVNYNVNMTFSKNENKVTEMGGASNMYYFSDGKPVTTGSSDLVTVIKEGYEAGAFFVMPTDGIINTEQKLVEYQKLKSNARMGDLIYVDRNGDGKISDDDRVYGGSGMPECEVGLNMGASYNGFDFSMNWYASIGNEIINGSKIYAYQSHTHKDLIYQWSYVNPTSMIPTYKGSSHDNYRAYADRWVEDGSFVRLKNIILGYSLPKKAIMRIGLNKCRFYLAADNLLTLTKYTGYDPEVGSNGLSKRGLDLGTYPISVQMRGGFQLEF